MSFKKRYVAMSDILGFRQFIRDHDLIDAVSRFERLRTHAIIRSAETTVHRFDAEEGYTLEIERIPYVLFSDTLLMWVDAEGESPETVIGVQNFFDGLGALLAYSSVNNLPFRTGVSYGECFIDVANNMYLGEVIVEAHEVEQNQQWFGGACHPNCTNAPFFINVVKRNALVIPYEVPCKNESLRLQDAIEWVSYAPPDHDELLRDRISNTSQADVQVKFRNALNFYSLIRPPACLRES
jgi:hypothetical protein